MPYVQRDMNSNIVGVYEQLQPGYATEFLANTDPAVLDFINRPLTPPNPTIISSSAFFGRFMALGLTAAVWAACLKDTTGQLGAGLTHGMVLAEINLQGAETQRWMAGLVAAGAITQAQSDTILTP